MTRTNARKGFDPEVRIALAEADIDTIDDNMGTILKRLDRLVYSAMAASITFGTSAALLAFNLVFLK